MINHEVMKWVECCPFTNQVYNENKNLELISINLCKVIAVPPRWRAQNSIKSITLATRLINNWTFQ